MTYTCNNKVYEATSLTEAWLKALNEQGVEAMTNASVVCNECNEWSAHVCLSAYRSAFPTFTDNDFLTYEKVLATAWLTFDKYTRYDYYEECEVTSLCDEGKKYILDNSELALYMDEINFCW